MSKPTQAAKTPATTKQPAKPAPAPDMQGGVALAEIDAGVLDLTGASSLQGQADRLGNARLQALQRQMLASKIGQTQGNGHLQQVVAFAKQQALSQPNTLPPASSAPTAPAVNGHTHAPLETHPEDDDTEAVPTDEELAALWGEPGTLTSAAPEPPPEARNGDAASVQRQEATAADAKVPTEAEKAAAKAKAAAARARAAQANHQGQAQADQARAGQAAEQTTGQNAKQKATTARSAAANKKAGPVQEIAVNGAGKGGGRRSAAPSGVAPTAPAVNGAPGKAPASAAEDPGFQAVVGKVQGAAGQEQAHAPAAAKAKEAQAAAESPASELAGKAQSGQVNQMDAAETPGFDAAGFKQKLMERIEALTPQTSADADEFKEKNKAGALKGEMQSETAAQKERAQAPLAAASNQEPNTGSVEPKPVTPLAGNPPGAAPTVAGAEAATPKPKGQSEVEAPLQQQSQQLDQQMADANVTEEQLAKSNEPEFQAAGAAKQASQQNAQTAPQAYRQDEQGVISGAQAEAAATVQGQTAAMHADRAGLLAQVDSQQGQGKSADEKKRAEVGAHIQGIYDKTKSKVESVLTSLDTEVGQLFDRGAEGAKQAFENYVDAEMEAFKEDRYGGLLGWAQWVADRFQPTQPRILQIFQEGRQVYIKAMGAVIDNVVALIGRKLAEAKAEIANGKQEIQDYVSKLPADLQQVGQEAAQNIQSQFDELTQSVDAKQDALIDTLANKYNEKLKEVDARIEQLKAENETLYDKAANVIGGVIKTILQLKDMLLNVLARAAAAIEKIISDPIGFLGNLIAGVKQGLSNFVSNIGTHLKEGFIGFLTGAVAGAGITMPQNWDLAGIFQFVMQILGLSFESLMGKVSQLFGFDIMSMIEPVKQIIGIYQEGGFAGLIKAGIARLIGEERMAALLQVWDIIQVFISGNWAKLWELIQEHLSNLKEMVFGKIEEFLVERVVKAGITWVVSLFNPAGAFIKACKMIYDVVMFFVERGSQIMSLVNAVIDSVTAIASGNIGPAAAAIEGALAKGIPVAIGFLSSLLGLGNVSEKVQEIIQGVRGLVDKAINAIFNLPPVKMVVGFIKKVIGKIKGAFGFAEQSDSPEANKSETLNKIGENVSFTNGAENHQLWVEIENGHGVVKVASRPDPVKDKLRPLENHLDKLLPDKQSNAITIMTAAKEQSVALMKKADQVVAAHKASDPKIQEYNEQVIAGERELVATLRSLYELYKDVNIRDVKRITGYDDPGLTSPQGISEEQWVQVKNVVISGASHLGTDIRVQGSRAAGVARPDSDLDFAVRVSPERFLEIARDCFGIPGGKNKTETMEHALTVGKIQTGEAKLRSVRERIIQITGISKCDVSVIRVGGLFDNPPMVKL